MSDSSVAPHSLLNLNRAAESPETSDGSGGNRMMRWNSEADGMNSAEFTLNKLSVGRVVGVGSYSVVRITQDTHSTTTLALKRMSKTTLIARKALHRAQEELQILRKLRHSLITTYFGAFQDESYLYLLTEFVPGGELLSILQHKGRFSQAETRFYSSEIVTALCYLHSHRILYRDLKLENVLISSSGHIKLADFGCGKVLKSLEKTYSLVGTPQYLAPEMITRSGHGVAADWWALGVVVCEMMTGETPFAALTPYETYVNIITKPPKIEKGLSCEAVDLIEGLLRKTAESRYGGEQVHSHTFFQGVDWSRWQEQHPPMIPLLKDALDTHYFPQYHEFPPHASPFLTRNSLFSGF